MWRNIQKRPSSTRHFQNYFLQQKADKLCWWRNLFILVTIIKFPSYQLGTYNLKVNNRNSRRSSEICSKWFEVNNKDTRMKSLMLFRCLCCKRQIDLIPCLLFQLLTLNKLLPAGTIILQFKKYFISRNFMTDFQSKSMNWFLYDRDLRHKELKQNNYLSFPTGKCQTLI